MSGGIDSSVAAALLLQKGYKAIGVHMKIPYADSNIRVIEHVTQQLGIPLVKLDLTSPFKEEVIDYFAKAYLFGHTPNPCVVCNEKIKFGLLLNRIKKIGANRLATGHYARTTKRHGRYFLLRAKDLSRDQSYFLHRLTQEHLSSVIFPLGDLKKDEVGLMAKNFGLANIVSSDSQEICFVPHLDYRRFLMEYLGSHILKTGEIVDTRGNILGRHTGIYGFTIGQRSGLGVSSHAPYYVKNLDVTNNRVIVGRKKDLLSKGLIAKDVNWIAFGELGRKLKVKTKIRYRHKETDSVIIPEERGKVRVTFNEPQEAVTLGQAAAFYRGNSCLGGGWIESVLAE